MGAAVHGRRLPKRGLTHSLFPSRAPSAQRALVLVGVELSAARLG